MLNYLVDALCLDSPSPDGLSPNELSRNGPSSNELSINDLSRKMKIIYMYESP